MFNYFIVKTVCKMFQQLLINPLFLYNNHKIHAKQKPFIIIYFYLRKDRNIDYNYFFYYFICYFSLLFLLTYYLLFFLFLLYFFIKN